MNNKRGWVCGALFLVSTTSWAVQSGDQALFFDHAVTMFSRAQKDVNSDQKIQGLLKGSDAHFFGITGWVQTDAVETVKFQHFYKGVEVFGSKVLHHNFKQAPAPGFLTAIEGDTSDVSFAGGDFDLDVTPTLSAEEVAGIALSLSGSGDSLGLEGMPELKILPRGEAPSARLIYWVTTRGDGLEAAHDVLIDAHSGAVIADLSRNIEIAPINVYSTLKDGVDVKGCQKVNAQGRPQAIDLTQCAKVVSLGRTSKAADLTARQAALNSRKVLNYFKSRHARNSFDGIGGAVTSLVHIGKKFDNAFWSSDMKLMAYGDGDGVTTGDFTNAVDVAGHEMTHGVVSETAKLIYMDQSGALNEAFADFFGKMVENSGDWVIGRKIFLDPKAEGIRDLKVPGNMRVCAKRDASGGCSLYKPYPASMKEMFTSSETCGRPNDNCWVHVNSTIIGHAAYEMVQLVGKEKTEKLMYLVLNHYLTETSKFRDFASATNNACLKVMDYISCVNVRRALADVGL